MVPHAIIIHWRIKLARFALHKTLTVLCTPNLKTLLMHTLSYYLAELFLISYYSWGISFLNTLLRYSQSWTLLTYTLCYYMAELYPILVHCRTMVYLNTLLSVFTKRCRQPIRIEYYVTRKPRELSTRVKISMVFGRYSSAM